MTAVMVLDFDGTVLDTEWPAYQSWAEIWADHGHDLSLLDWARRIGTHHDLDAFAELQALVGRPLDPGLEEVRRVRKDLLTDEAALNPGVLAWLDEAAWLGLPVGIASSSPTRWIERNLARLELRDRFSVLACCENGVPSKPDPASYRLAVEQLGGDPRLSVAVEDSEHGIAAAVDAGLFTVAVPHRLTAHMDLSRAHLVVESLDVLTLSDALERAADR